MPRKILIVDDEPKIVEICRDYLQAAGFDVISAGDGPGGLALARQESPDLVVLDLMLPEMDGLDVCRALRHDGNVPIIMLTARVEETDRLIGLELGADDYMTKPFSPRELVARLRAMLRRPRQPAEVPEPSSLRTFGTLAVDPVGRDVWLDGEPVSLTRTEFDVLAVLSDRPRMAFSRRQLIDRVWGETWVGDEHLVDVHVGHLRRKLGDDAGAPRFIRTVRGIGYRMGTGA